MDRNITNSGEEKESRKKRLFWIIFWKINLHKKSRLIVEERKVIQIVR